MIIKSGYLISVLKKELTMKPTEETLSVWFDDFNREHFDNKITKIPVHWNGRLRTCAGQCKYNRVKSKIPRTGRFEYEYTPFAITLSNKLFENNDWDESKIKRTLIHEMTHAFLLEHYNETGHTIMFQSIMRRITGEAKNHRCHDYDVEGLRNKRDIEIICPTHGVIGMRARMPKKGLMYKCRSCKNFVYFKRKSGFKPLF